jgi:signal transduction histidine kinase
MINVVNNACKYTDHGSVEFFYAIKNGSLEFTVKDTGIGIHDDLKESIFNRFMQVSLSRTAGRNSTGLGLAITKTYLTLMGGNISVKSKLGEGSEFTFELPDIFNFEN